MLGYKPKSVRKRKNSAEKQNVSGNSAKRFTYPLSPLIADKNGLRNISSPTVTPQDNVATLRTPFSNITNIVENNVTSNRRSSLGDGGLRQMTNLTVTPEDTVATVRTPLCNITNIVQNNVRSNRFSSLGGGGGGHRKRTNTIVTPEDNAAAIRTPLSNITNIVQDNVKSKRRSLRGLYDNKFEETARNLFPETSSHNAEKNKYLQDDDIECSVVQDPVLSDDSEDEFSSG
ncbi:hypothetical protein DCAR_0729365 [Daucus carota subsp. sativus]|uniref:Uncharacterized protein n=1 Tax=Daucus carota subsp. sativus TaxID=79200 RepID=A0AAF1B8A7_DAUCS|nr:hypothetical protein DCAR_0729365 [Daucus carota subsp. sativus]